MPQKPACGPCNRNCEQGRRCPARQPATAPQLLARFVKLLRPQQRTGVASPH